MCWTRSKAPVLNAEQRKECLKEWLWGAGMKFVLIFLLAVAPLTAEATTFDIGQGNRVFVPLKSLKALRDENLIRQAFDYSCGAAAFATLLTYGLGDQVTEQEILLQAFQALSKDEETLRKKEGLSLLDLQKIAHVRGHKAQGFRLKPAFLAKLQGPVIVFIKPRGYEHFAVLKGIRGDRVYLADPSLGNVRMPMYKFIHMWLGDQGKGIIFIVERIDGTWPADYALQIPPIGMLQPEVLSARQLLEVGTSSPPSFNSFPVKP